MSSQLVWFVPGIYSFCGIRSHSTSTCSEDLEWGFCWHEKIACRQHHYISIGGFPWPYLWSSPLCTWRSFTGVLGLLLCGLHGSPYPWPPNPWDVSVLPTIHPRGTLAQGRWLTGERLRCKAAVDSSLLWHSLVPGLQVATILSTCPSGGLFCTICREPDHSASQCASSSVIFPWHEWLSAFHGTKDSVGVPSRTFASIGMCAPCVGKTIGLSIAQMPQLGLDPQVVQLGLNPRSLLGHSTGSNPRQICFVMLCFWFVYQLFWFLWLHLISMSCSFCFVNLQVGGGPLRPNWVLCCAATQYWKTSLITAILILRLGCVKSSQV